MIAATVGRFAPYLSKEATMDRSQPSHRLHILLPVTTSSLVYSLILMGGMLSLMGIYAHLAIPIPTPLAVITGVTLSYAVLEILIRTKYRKSLIRTPESRP